MQEETQRSGSVLLCFFCGSINQRTWLQNIYAYLCSMDLTGGR